jgi:ribosome-associated translation inhibitor RaiA
MKFLANSTNEKYTRRLNTYGKEKLEKPLVRHKFDSDNVTIRTDLEDVGSTIQLKVVVMITASDHDINAVIDLASDKLERLLSDLKDRKRATRRSAENAKDHTEEFGEDDYLTDGEEEALREMGALDDVLDI